MADSANIWKQLLQLARKHQQYCYEICSDWNLYTENDYNYLKDFIGYAMFGPPSNLSERSGRIGNHSYPKAQDEIIDKVLEQVIEYGAKNSRDKSVQCGIIYNFIFNSESIQSNIDTDDPELLVYPVPIFKVTGWKTVSKGHLPEIWYIDISARVYTGFLDYVTNNTLPEYTMVLPKNGIYQMAPSDYHSDTKNGETKYYTSVWLEVHESPASSTTAKILSGGDVVSTVSGIASTVIGIAAMLTPVSAVATAAGVIGLGVSSLWTAGRCTHQLYDRSQHSQSIIDKESRGAWISIAGSTIGLAAATGPYLMIRAIKGGITIGKTAEMTYNTVMIGSVLINGIGTGSKGCDLVMNYYNGEEISTLEVGLFAAHIFFLFNSAINLKLAKTLIQTTQGEIFKDYEASLRSNRHRKEFQRMVRNTQAAGNDPISNNEEIIRVINRIDDKDAFFQAVVQNRKSLSANRPKAKCSDGKVKIESTITIDPIKVSKLPKVERIKIIKNMTSTTPSAPIPFNSSIPKSSKNKTLPSGYCTAMARCALEQFRVKHPKTKFHLDEVVGFTSVLNDLENIENWLPIFNKLLTIGNKIYEALQGKITMRSFLSTIVTFIWEYIKTIQLSNFSQFRTNDHNMQRHIQEWVDQFQISVENRVNVWVEDFMEWLHENYSETAYTKHTLA